MWNSLFAWGVVALALGYLACFVLWAKLKTRPRRWRRLIWAATLFFHGGIAVYAFLQMGFGGLIVAGVEAFVAFHCLIGLAASLRSQQ